MNAWPMRRRFSCGSVMPVERLQNRSSPCTTCRSVLKWSVNSRITDCLFVFAQQAVVDQDARQLRSDRLVQQRRDDGRIDTAAEARRSRGRLPTCSRTSLDRSRRQSRPVSRSPSQPQTPMHKVLQQLAAQRRVRDFGVELHSKDRQLAMLDRGDRDRSPVLRQRIRNLSLIAET